MRGLIRIERARQACFDIAEGAGARAGVAHDHEGGVLLLPALADVRAAGLLAYRVQAVGTHDGVGIGVALRYRRFDADPVGLFRHGRIRPVRLFRMARTRVVEVEDDGHERYLRLRRVRRKAAPRRPQIRPALSPARSSKKMTAPMVAVIRLPQKSGMTCRLSFSNRKPPTMAPISPIGEIVEQPAAAAEDLRRQPAGDQADNDPEKDAHGGYSPARFLLRHARLYAGHPRLIFVQPSKAWMAGTCPAMTS